MGQSKSSNNLTRMYGVGAFTFILFLSTLIGAPVLPALSKELGASNTAVPVIVSASLATVVIAQFFTGILADRGSKRTLILIGALLGSVSSFLVLAASSWEQLLGLRILAGIADAIAMPALLVITSELGTGQPGRFFGILRGSQGLSYVAGPALGAIFSLASLRTPFLADGILSLVAFAVAYKLVTKDEKVTGTHDLNVFSGIRQMLKNRRMYLYILLGITGMFAYSLIGNFIPTKAQLLNFTPWQIGLILSTGALVHSITSFTAGPLTDKYGRKLFVIASQSIIIGSAIALMFCNSLITILIVYSIFVVGETIPYLLSFVYASESFDKKYMGASMAVFDSIIDLSLVVGPLIGISVYGITGNIDYPFIIAAIPAVLCLLMLFSLKEKG